MRKMIVLFCILLLPFSYLYSQTNQIKYFRNDSTGQAYTITSLTKDSLDNLYILGFRDDFPNKFYSIIKTGPTGNIIWSKQLLDYGTGVNYIRAYNVHIINDYLYILYRGFVPSHLCHLWKLDLNGNLVSSKKIPNYASQYNGNANIKSNANNYYIAYANGNKIRNFCFDLNDNLLWAKSIDVDSTNNDLSVLFDIEIDANGGILGIAYNNYVCCFYNISVSGNINWVKTSNQTFTDGTQFKTLHRLNDNKYLITGISNPLLGTSNGAIALMDSLGNITSTKYIDQWVGGIVASDTLYNGNILLRGNFDAGSVSMVTHYLEIDTALNIIQSNRRSANADYLGIQKNTDTDSGFVFGLDTTIHFTPGYYNSCDPLWTVVPTLMPTTSLIMSASSNYTIDTLNTILNADEASLVDVLISTISICDQLVGVENEEPETFDIYPNPFTDQINISYSGSIKALEIYTLDGKKILGTEQPTAQTTSLNLAGLSPGVYILYLYQNESIMQRKLIKQ